MALQNTTGIFVGEEWQSSGNRADGQSYERYKLKFKPDINSDKTFSMTLFTPSKFPKTLQLGELKKGTRYKLLYNENEFTNKQGIPSTSRTIAGIFTPSTEDEQQQSRSTNSKINLDSFDSFKTKYMELVKKNGISPNTVHMIGSYIATYEKERITELLAKCKEALK